MSTHSPTQATGDRSHPCGAAADPGGVEAWETDGGACADVQPPRAPQAPPTATRAPGGCSP